MRLYQSAVLALTVTLSCALSAIAAPLAEITLEKDAIRNQEIASDSVRVVVKRYEPINFETEADSYLIYEIYIDGNLKTQVRDKVDFIFGDLHLENLDPDGIPEIVFHRYTGGAHCCSIYTLYSWQGDRLHRTLTYPLDASAAGTFEDLDGDGYSEFTSSDGRFLYAFGSYASSWPPGVVLSFRNGMLVDVTRQFPKRLRSQMQAAYQQAENIYAQEDALGINSILAGYVAQKILLGEYQSGWDYMLAHYDPTDTWGLTTTTPSGEVVQKYPDYPSALTDFLIDLEYLTVNGTPNPNLDLSRTIVEQESLL